MRGVFVRRDDEDVVLVVDAEVESRLQVSVMPFLPRRLLRDRAEGLARVQTTGEHAQTLERDGNGDFAVAAPIVAAADGAAARDLARRLATLEAVRFVAEEPATEHGLGQPRLTARFRFDGPLPEDAADEHSQNDGQDDGHGHGHEPTGPDAPDRDHTLRVGAATEGGAFAQLDERPEVFILPRAVLDALDKPLVSSDLLRTRRTELSAFTLERGGVTLEVTHDGAAFVTRDGTVPDERMEGVLMSLERMRGDRAAAPA